MLTEILIKPFIEDLKCDGVEDVTPYEIGFKAGMTALSSILSDNIDNQPQLFTYLGMAISEGMQWVESQVIDRDNVAPIFAKKYPPIDDPRWETPSTNYLGCECYGISFEGELIKGKLNIDIAGNFILETDRPFGNAVSKIIALESPNELRERQPTPSSHFEKEKDFGVKVTYRDDIIPPPLEWDYLHTLDERDGNFIQKYLGKDVWFSFSDDLGGPQSPGKAVLDLSGFIQVLDISGNQIKRPYYIKLR